MAVPIHLSVYLHASHMTTVESVRLEWRVSGKNPGEIWQLNHHLNFSIKNLDQFTLDVLSGDEMQMETNSYNAWSIALQVLIWIAMIATFAVYYRQLKTMQKAAIGQNILSLVNFLQAEHVRDARTTVLGSLKSKKYADWTDDEKRQASLACSTYDVASILIYQQKLMPPDPFISNWGPSIKGCFESCREHIAEMQKPANSGPHYWNDVKILYDEVVKHAAAQP